MMRQNHCFKKLLLWLRSWKATRVCFLPLQWPISKKFICTWKDYSGAEDIMKRVITIRKGALGDTNPEIGKDLNDLCFDLQANKASNRKLSLLSKKR